MIETRFLGKAFGRKILFDKASFRLPDTGLVLLTGENGSGKSTLLYLLCSLTRTTTAISSTKESP